jgi:hypothetical protein
MLAQKKVNEINLLQIKSDILGDSMADVEIDAGDSTGGPS